MDLQSSDTLKVIHIQQGSQSRQQFSGNPFAEVWHLNAKVFIDFEEEYLEPCNALWNSKGFCQTADESHADRLAHQGA